MDLPPRFGNWNSIYVRFRRWVKAGVWQRLFDSFTDKEMKVLLIDSNTVKAHQHSAGAQKKNKQGDEAIGRSRGGLTTKVHLGCDERGRVQRIVLSGGQVADVRMSLDLVVGIKPQKVIADKAYDAGWLLHFLDSEGIEALIPPKSSRLQQRIIDYNSYKQRNMIERTINRLKHYRKLATRYEKTVASFQAICCLAATLTNLKL